MAGTPDRPEAAGQRLPRARRITRGGEIRSLFQRGKRSRTRHLDVYVSDSPFVYPRVGLVVPRHRRSAVLRNRLKRRLREVVRTEVLPRLSQAGLPLDVLVRARAEAYGVDYPTLRAELGRWVEERCSRAS